MFNALNTAKRAAAASRNFIPTSRPTTLSSRSASQATANTIEHHIPESVEELQKSLADSKATHDVYDPHIALLTHWGKTKEIAQVRKDKEKAQQEVEECRMRLELKLQAQRAKGVTDIFQKK